MYELAVIFLLLLVNANKTVLTHKLSRWQCAQPIETVHLTTPLKVWQPATDRSGCAMA